MERSETETDRPMERGKKKTDRPMERDEQETESAARGRDVYGSVRLILFLF